MTATHLITTDGEAAARRVTEALLRRGFRVLRSFDLRSAVTGHHACPCPHHGTDQCTCQFVVLLAYALAGAPVVITAHGRDAVTEVQIVEDANAPSDPAATGLARAALEEAALTAALLPATVEVNAC
jgi:hypothetical protein